MILDNMFRQSNILRTTSSRDSPLPGSPETDSGSESLRVSLTPGGGVNMPEAAAPDSHLSSLTSSLKVRLVVKLTLTDVDLWTLFFYPGQDEDSAWNIQQTA